MTIMAAVATGERTAEVWARLESVIDPELDESVTELGFVTGVEVDSGGHVRVDFRLPTYWCAANFAFLMADDMRIAVAALPWVEKVTVGLGEHMYADEINRGVAAGLSFQATFGSEASGELEEVRRTFMVKAFQRRQEALLTYLLDQGHESVALLRLTVVELAALPCDTAGHRLIVRYLERRPVIGSGEGELAFVDQDGALLDAGQIHAYLRALRRVGVNAEFNSALCRGLLATRYGAGCAPQVEVKPVHFVRSVGVARST
ncbi:metal-sulfur cluster assembly factor [Burkholderia sp. S171]|uniref:metal-sulfur cluster assembly factor n=1 Tax=Burkholderia sp. S171 TaxID=1641860 RepID=UPI00131C1E03|nr:iron-sulfur cluster assembly protein [Burkholderia sp. S171]